MVSGRDPVLVNEPARGPARDYERIRKRKKSKVSKVKSQFSKVTVK